MEETILVQQRMSEIRLDELELESGFAYYVNDPDSIEHYKERENMVVEICKKDEGILASLRAYEKNSGVYLDLEEVVPIVMGYGILF